jgi:guanine nucleotide-binding protein subunit alpha, other
MCFGGGEKGGDVEGANKSREIDKQIRQDEKKMAREVKLLLLGRHHHSPNNLYKVSDKV